MDDREAALVWDHAHRYEREWLIGPVAVGFEELLFAEVSGDEERIQATRFNMRTFSRKKWKNLPPEVRTALLDNGSVQEGLYTILQREVGEEN